jgi:hypothetical protein
MLRASEAWKVAGLLGLAGAVALSGGSASPRQASEHKQQTATEARSLRRGETVELNAPPPTVTNLGCKCDADGDIYVVYWNAPPVLAVGSGLSGLPVWKILPRSKQVVRYPVPARIQDFEGNVFRFSFDVSPDGTLYALFNTARRDLNGKMQPEDLIGKYEDDGGIDSYVHIGQMRGTRLEPIQMAVFKDGHFLLSGTTVLQEGLGSFTGLFTEGGEFVKLLTLGEPVIDREHALGGSAAGGSAKPAEPPPHAEVLGTNAKNPVALAGSTLSFSARDGNVYLLQGTSEATLYVVSAGGEVLREYPLHPPAPGVSPLQMAQAGAGYLFIYYGYVSAGGPSEKTPPDMITVINSTTGEVTATYRVPDEQRMRLPACAESPQKFTFLGVSEDDKHLAVTPYSAY